MPQIDISDDTADALFRDMLTTDYRRLREQIYHLKQRELKQYEQEDLENSIRYFEAIKVMMGYYLTHDEAKALQDEQD